MRRFWERARATAFWAGPFALPGAAAYYLYLFYDNLPDRFPIHWGQRGVADHWADKSVQGVFFGPVMGALVMIFAALAEALIFAAQRNAPVVESAAGGPDVELARRRRVGWLNWLLGVIFGLLSVLPGIAPEEFLLPGWVMATGAFLVVVIALFATLKIKR